MAVATSITGELLATQRCRATGNNTPPRLGLWRVQRVLGQIRCAELAQHIGQGGASHGNRCGLQLGQTGEQVQRIHALGRSELRADQVQVALRGADVAMTQEATDGVQVHAAFE